MKHTDKEKYAEQMADYVFLGHSFEETKQHFIEHGLSKYDISNMFYKVKSIVTNKYGDSVKAELLKAVPEFKKDDFPLHDEVIKYLIEGQISEIKRVATNEINRLCKLGAKDEEMIQKVENRFVSRDTIIKQINLFYNVEEEEETSGGRIALGVLMILIGGGVSINAMTSPSGGYVLYGLVIYGFVILFKGLDK